MLHIFASISAWYSDKQSETMRAVSAARPEKYKAPTLVFSTFANTFVLPKRPFQHVNHKRMYTAPAETRTLTKTWSVVAQAVFCFARGRVFSGPWARTKAAGKKMPRTGAVAHNNKKKTQARRVETVKKKNKIKATRFKALMVSMKKDRKNDAQIAAAINETSNLGPIEQVSANTFWSWWRVLGLDPLKLKNSVVRSTYIQQGRA
jgi:hypothetical protein